VRDGDLAIFDEVLETVVAERPLGETFDLIARRVAELGAFDFCGVLLPDADRRRIHLAGAHDFPEHYQELLDGIFQVPFDDERFAGSPTAQALRERRTVVLEDAFADPAYEPWRPLAEDYGFRSLVSVPLITQGEAVGVLNGYSTEPREFDREDLAAMERLARHAALALRITLLVEAQHETIAELRDSNDQLEHHRSVLERAHAIHLRLTEAVIAGAGYEAVAQIVAELIGRPVAITDAHGAILCSSDPPPDADALAQFEAALAQLAQPRTRPRRGRTGAQEPPPVIAGEIRVGEEALGCVLVQDGEPASRDLDVRAIEHAATVLSVHVAKERVARATEERLSADFLFDLLNARDSEQRLAERAAHHGLTLGEEHRVLVVVLDDAADAGQDGRQRRAKLLRIAADTLRERLPRTLLSQLGTIVTAVVPSGGAAGADPLARLRSAVAECRRRVEQAAPGTLLSAGIGSAARRPADFVASYGEAQQCVETLRRLERAGETTAIDELGVLGLFLDTNRPDQLVALGRKVLGPAIDHDRSSDGTLLATLESYLDHGCNLRACADALYVHPNTVKYRLRRIEELCGLDLRTPDDLLKATLARLSLKLLEAQPPVVAT
jgi:sugar diacid utilization regulator